MRETRQSGSEGGGAELNRLSLPLFEFVPFGDEIGRGLSLNTLSDATRPSHPTTVCETHGSSQGPQ